MSGALMGKICGCSGLTGGQYLSVSQLRTLRRWRPRARVIFQVLHLNIKLSSFISNLPIVNKITLYFCKKKNKQTSFILERISTTGTICPKFL